MEWKVLSGITLGDLEKTLNKLCAEGWTIFQVIAPGIGIIAYKEKGRRK